MKLAILIGAFLIAATAANANPFENFYDNTAVSTMSDGGKMTYYLNRDGTFESHFSDGSVVKGHYTWQDAQTACFLPTAPPPPPGTKAVCRHYPDTHKVGDVWTEQANGSPVTDTIVKGRDGLPK
ncbi:MAG TPA: hypothetical protein VHW02_02465 [Rhizomicrobium sp.]|jgi:hypothetical protein|nr:hypothetical protein [Rhizomicrobium sp.]